MNGPLFKTIIILATLALALTCRPQAEEEEKKWATNVQDLKTCMAAYPAFKPILTQTLANAEKLRDQAKKTRDSEKKVELKAKANKKIRTAILTGLGSAIRLTASIKKKQRKMWHIKVPAKRRESATQARLFAARKIKEVKKILATFDGSTNENALETINEANAGLKEADGLLDRMIKSIEGAKKRKKTK